MGIEKSTDDNLLAIIRPVDGACAVGIPKIKTTNLGTRRAIHPPGLAAVSLRALEYARSGHRSGSLVSEDGKQQVAVDSEQPAQRERVVVNNQVSFGRPSIPGAYSAGQGGTFHRLSNIAFSVLGLPPHMRATLPELENHNLGQAVVVPTNRVGPNSNQFLAEATPVANPCSMPSIEAQPFDIDAGRRRSSNSKEPTRCIVICLFLVVVGVVGVVLGIALKVGNNKTTSALRPTYSAPSLAPSEAPSAAPSISLDKLFSSLPQYTLKSINNISTPQWKAQDWLSRHPDLPGMEEWRMKQLFALVTFYFSMEGPSWPEAIKEDWLLYDKPECLWYSSEFGGFYGEDGRYTEEPSYGLQPCNEQNEYTLLLLSQLGLAEHKPFLPPEISMLTSLSILTLPRNNLNVSLDEFLPSQIYQMTNLTNLNLQYNFLTGTIPTELGLMTALEVLGLQHSSLTGPIPSQLGLMVRISKIGLQDNELTSFIPSQLGKLTHLGDLFLWGNTLSGRIPNEISLMTTLHDLYVSENLLTGPIPSALGLLTNMERLGLQANSLSGSIPSEIGNMRNLTKIHAFRNNLSGVIPSEFGRIISLEQVELAWNSFSGFLPSEFGQLKQMTRLALVDNMLSGRIPSELGEASSLNLLFLSNNTLTGPVPLELDMLVVNHTLELLWLQNNDLSGTVSENLCLLGQSNATTLLGLSFDCSDQLCGCEWCDNAE